MTAPIKIILLDIPPDEYILAIRSVRFQLERKDGGRAAILQYGEAVRPTAFYVKRNKSSITVRKR